MPGNFLSTKGVNQQQQTNKKKKQPGKNTTFGKYIGQRYLTKMSGSCPLKLDGDILSHALEFRRSNTTKNFKDL